MLDLLGRFRKPMAYAILGVGVVGMITTFPLGWTIGLDDSAFWVTLAGFFLLTLDGYDKLMDLRDSEQLDDIENGIDES